jgi:hypothetical protein
MPKITEVNDDNRLTAIQPNGRKFDHLARYYQSFIEDGATTSRVRVTREVELDREEWLEFTHALLDDREWLKDQGGTSSDYETKYEDVYQLMNDKPEFERWKAQAYDKVVKVVHDSGFETFTIFVDPQGHSYARYVLFPVDRGIGEQMFQLHQAVKKAA